MQSKNGVGAVRMLVTLRPGSAGIPACETASEAKPRILTKEIIISRLISAVRKTAAVRAVRRQGCLRSQGVTRKREIAF